MPRQFDYDAGDIGAVNYEGKRLGIRSLGRLEDRALFFGPEDCVFGWFYGQFQATIYDTAFMDRVHAWVDETATAPWYWFEHLTNHGHSVDTQVWFSQDSDAMAFALHWLKVPPPAPWKEGFRVNASASKLNADSIARRQRFAEAQGA